MPRLKGPRASENPQLNRFLDGRDDPFCPQELTAHSLLPAHARHHRDPQYRGESSRSINTSRLVQNSNDSHGSLPGQTSSVESLTSNSEHTSIAVRDLDRSLRTLSIGDNNLAQINGPGTQRPALQCPFRLLDCILDYSRFDDWFRHSLTHFQTNHSHRERPTPEVTPPTNNRCCFCAATFYSPDGMRSWYERMRHVEQHHQIGHTLAHARPDFQLFDYLWENHLIDEIDYREIKGNTRDQSRVTHGNPSPPTSDSAGSPPSTPVPESRPVAVLNEPRDNRGRRSRGRGG